MNRWIVHVKNFGKIEDASVEAEVVEEQELERKTEKMRNLPFLLYGWESGSSDYH